MVVFGYLMVIIYIGLGILLMIPKVYPYIPKNVKFVFSLFFIAYGIFRLVRILNSKAGTNEPEEE